jgi:hypothetical protein
MLFSRATPRRRDATVGTVPLLDALPQFRYFPGQLAALQGFQQHAGQAADAVSDLGVDFATPHLVDRQGEQGGDVPDRCQRQVWRIAR